MDTNFSYHVIPLQEQNIPTLLELCSVCMPQEGFDDASLFEAWFRNKKALGYGIKKHRKIIAFIFGIRLENEYYIMCICVLPEFKNQGIGKKLIQMFLLDLPENLPVWCKIHKCNTPSLRAFKRFGFKEERKKNIPGGLTKSFRTHYIPFKRPPSSYNITDFDLYKEVVRLQHRILNLV